jgi:signal transduction histidine kinase
LPQVSSWRRYALPGLAVGVLAIAQVDLMQHYEIAVGAAWTLSVARAAPVALARWRVRLAFVIELAAVTATALAGRPVSHDEPWPWAIGTLIAVLPVLAVLGARCSRRVAAIAWALVTADGFALHYAYPGRGNVAIVIFMAVAAAATLLLADASRGRDRATAALAEQQQVGAAERARRALLEERARIARELHDVVAHHMSVIAVQADSAPYRLADVTADTGAEFASIADSARRSLAEMRRLLDVLRGEDTAALAPQPGLTELSELVENACAAGIPTELRVDAGLVSQSVALTAYRVVQEALSNVIRHAPGASTAVAVTAADGILAVRVHNGPPLHPAARTEAGGHGLVGMRERITALDGTLSAGPSGDGGFEVVARLPM